jgi:hypothetical protein
MRAEPGDGAVRSASMQRASPGPPGVNSAGWLHTVGAFFTTELEGAAHAAGFAALARALNGARAGSRSP